MQLGPHSATTLLLWASVLAACGAEKKSESVEKAQAPAPASVEIDAQPASAPAEEAVQTTPPTATQIDELAARIIVDKFKDRELQGELWTQLYSLESWHLMTFPDSKSVPPGLNIETHEGKKWVMAFTDTDRLHAYAASRKQLNSDGSMLGMSVPSQTSFGFFEGLVGIEGVRFNEGETGWFAPMRNLRAIHVHLKKQGKL